MSGYTKSDRAAAVRCVDCPWCFQVKGEQCRIAVTAGYQKVTRTHKQRVDKYFRETYGPDSPAVKELLAEKHP